MSGLELIDEEELEKDTDDEKPIAYLMVPDIRALREIESLWRRWQSGQLVWGETPWQDVFALLRDLRPWGPNDRVRPLERNVLKEEIDGRDEGEPIKLEIELVYRANDAVATEREDEVRGAIASCEGRVVSRARIEDIAYHALLVELPVRAVREIVERSLNGIAGLEPVMHIRPQSVATAIDVAEDRVESDRQVEIGVLADPILALLDGVPVAAHPLLTSHADVVDQFDLEPNAPVADRAHGTAMASLIVHGDRNRPEPSLPRRIRVVPVLGSGDAFPDDRLIVDLVYTAVVAMREGDEAHAPGVVIVNLSLGNRRRPFHGHLSAWARLLDRLAYDYGILFVVSAGNCADSFEIAGFANSTEFEGAPADRRASETLRALGRIVAERKLFSPAETVNGLTVGACNDDAVPAATRAAAQNIDPYPNLRTSNPSSALGPGFALSVKPDVLMPGAREHLRVIRSDGTIDVIPAKAARQFGLKVAAPPKDGRENQEGYTNGTSAAAALASRTCHRIHDALEAAYGDVFLSLPTGHRAVLLKALLAHTAKWPDEAAKLIRDVIGPPEGKYHSRQKDNIRRFLGYGVVDADAAVACAADRATFWATGTLEANKIAAVSVPVPVAMGGQARFHALCATLAWFTPTMPGRKSYRAVRLKVVDPEKEELSMLRMQTAPNQPDGNQTNRGTLFTRCWSGKKAPAVGPDMSIRLTVQRNPDQGLPTDEPIPFGLAVTLTMPGVVEIYEQVRQRLRIAERVSSGS